MKDTIGLICGLLASHLAAPVLAGGQSDGLSRCFQRLAERQTDPPPETVVAELVSYGVESLSFFYANFDGIDRIARSRFRGKVVPKLPAAKASDILLAEFRQDTPVAEEIIRLLERGEKEGRTHTLRAAYAKIEGRFRRLRWTTAALGNLEYSNGYGTVHSVYLQFSSIGDLHHNLVRALYGIDPVRAIEDFTSLARSPDNAMRLKGVSSFRRIGQLPPCALIARLIDDPVEQIRREAAQLILGFDLDCLDLLIELSGHKDKNVRGFAEYGLCFLAHIPKAHAQEMIAAAGSSLTPADVWRTWWERGRQLSEDERRRRGLTIALKMAENDLDVDLVRFLSGFAEYPEVYPAIERALVNAVPSIKHASVRAIQRMAWKGQPDATDFLLDYCTHHEIQDSIALVDALAKTGDPRAVPVLLKMLEQSRDKDYTWPRHILLALGKTGDRRAVKPVLQWLLEHTDGSEQSAAMALPDLTGADAVQSQLLRKLVQAPHANTRYALRKSIEAIGGEALAGELVRVLPDADAGDDHREGSQRDILLLMEAYPDPAAKPMLQSLLMTDNRFSHLYAARVLGKLGDYTGVPIILEDLLTPKPMPYHFHAHDVGQALKEIGDPETRERLEALYRRVEGEDRGRVFNVIGQQEDRAFLPFLDKLVDDSTDPNLLCGAAGAIGRLIYSMYKDKPRQALEITDTNLAAARLMLRLAFHGERLRDFDGGFPDHALLAKMQGAVLKAGEYAYLLYKAEDGTLREMSMQNPDDAQLIAQAKPRSEDSFGYGSVYWMVYENYMSLNLHIDYGGSSHLFRMAEGRWAPVCSLGGVIE